MKTIATKAATWAEKLAGAQAAIAELNATDRQLREEHATAEKARYALIGAPGPPDEAVANLERLVDAAGAHWRAQHGGVGRDLSPGMELQNDGSLRELRPKLPDWCYRPLDGLAACGLFPELVKTALAAMIQVAEYDPGPARADRRAAVEEADRKIADLERQHSELCASAGALDPPVTIRYLPAVQARRDAAAVQARREQEAAADRRERERLVNEAHERQRQEPRAASSPYLEQGKNPYRSS